MYSRSRALPLLLLGLVSFASAGAFAGSSEDYTPRAAVELTGRDGLPNVLAKLARGERVVVAYLGGSITAQRGWRVLSREWLQERHPRAVVDEIHAAIGGTGSELGVFRLEHDVLAGRPDLLFVEFAVNDGSAPPARIRRAMEGIVRKTWSVLPATDICFVYTVVARDTAGLAEGWMKRSASVMEEVADHYGIPSVQFGVEVARLEQNGELVMRSDDAPVAHVAGDALDEAAELASDARGRIIFSKDGVHPYPETGHVLYARVLARSLEALAGVGEAGPREPRSPRWPDNWEFARRLAPDHPGVKIEGAATKLDAVTNVEAKRFAERMPTLWRLEPGAMLRFRFKGTKVAFYDLLGPEGAVLEIAVNGESRRVTRFDAHSANPRLAILGVAEDLPDSIHEVSVTVLADKPDKAAILGERHRADFERSSAKYEPTRWHAGAVLIVGEIVE